MVKYSVFLLIILAMMTSCANYYLTTDSLRKQFSGVDSTNLKAVTVRGPIGMQYDYLANPIDQIECTDKNGNPAHLVNSPSIEMRVTETSGKRSIFYFDRIFVTDSAMTGFQSRFISSIKKTIKLKNITKIEIQDGRKNFVYVSK